MLIVVRIATNEMASLITSLSTSVLAHAKGVVTSLSDRVSRVIPGQFLK